MTQPDVQATLQARFVDDDTLVRTGRALLEVNGYGWVVVPVPSGWAEQIEAVLGAAEDADTISVFVGAAEAAAESAEADRVVVEQAAMSASWSGDQLTVLGATSPPLSGEKGDPGDPGMDGVTPHVGANGNWFVGDTDTGVPAQGEKGESGSGTGDVLWSELDPVLDGKADVGHTHTMENITDLPEIRSSAAPDSLALRSGTGNVLVATTPSGPSSATSRAYVDQVVGEKADAGHQHSWGDVTGKPATYPPESHSHTASQISDATTVGRNVLTASSQSAARSAIGAGTSNLALGTTSSTAARGNHSHSQYIEGHIVSSMPASPVAGRVYFVLE